jgi:hypothetical protein
MIEPHFEKITVKMPTLKFNVKTNRWESLPSCNLPSTPGDLLAMFKQHICTDFPMDFMGSDIPFDCSL